MRSGAALTAMPAIEAEYAIRIERLLWALYENRERLDPDTVSTIETNLRVIDGAIGRAREALEEDPENPGLARMLNSNYRHKLQLLQRTLGQGVQGLAFENDHDGVEIRVEIPRRRRRDPERQVGDTHLEIMVPRGASLEIETLAASISVNGVAGNVLVQFTSGNVTAGTLTGNVRIIGGRIGEGRFESVSGTLYFEGEIGAGAELDFENFNGNIELLIPADSAAEFDISTYNGSIETEFGFEGRSPERYSPEQKAEFTLALASPDPDLELLVPVADMDDVSVGAADGANQVARVEAFAVVGA